MDYTRFSIVASALTLGSAAAQPCPELLGQASLPISPGEARATILDGPLLYVGTRDDGVRIFDVSDPSTPTFLGAATEATSIRDFAVSGSMLYVGNFRGLWIYDVSDPSNPALQSRLSCDSDCSTSVSPAGVAASGTMAYVINSQGSLPVVMSVDASDPVNPVVVGTAPYSGECAGDAEIHGNILFGLPCDPSNGGSTKIQVWDVTDPTELVELYFNSVGSGFSRNMPIDINGDAVTVSISDVFGMDFKFYDASDPSNLIFVRQDFFDGADYGGYASDGALGVQAFDNELRVLDTTIPYDPIAIASVQVASDIESVDVEGSLAAVVSGASVMLFDLSGCGSCPADLDGDGDADTDDFFAYLDGFATGDIGVCDIDGDGSCDSLDFFAYLDLFAAGC